VLTNKQTPLNTQPPWRDNNGHMYNIIIAIYFTVTRKATKAYFELATVKQQKNDCKNRKIQKYKK